MNISEILELHAKNKGKLSISGTVPVNTKEDLSRIYSPGVAEVSKAIHENPELLKEYTIAGKTVAVISNGTAVLGLGDIGAKAALPVMEGKCLIFKEFAGIDAFPICIDEKNTEEIIKTVKRIALNFAAINLEDFSAPNCFEIESRLSEELDIPVMHDDQHGTAIVTLAGLMGALDLTKKKNIKVLINGAGAAGNAIAKLLYKMKSELSIEEIKILDSKGVINTSEKYDVSYKNELAQMTLQNKFTKLDEAIIGVDVFIGVSIGNLLTEQNIKDMNPEPIIFGLANPIPEIMPDLAYKYGATIVATGRSDFSNQVNNALVYPGVFKGLIESGTKKVTDEIKILAAKTIYEYNKPNLSKDHILPSILDKNVPIMIAKAIINL